MAYLYFSSVFDTVDIVHFRSLGGNEIGPEGAQNLAKVLEINTTLTSLK